MYGSDWSACHVCGVKQRPEETTKVEVMLEGAALPRHACKDSVRCARFAMEMQGIEERRGPVQPPPVPQTGAVKRRCEEPTTRRRTCPTRKK